MCYGGTNPGDDVTESSKQRAAAEFKKSQRNDDRSKALTDYEAQAAAMRVKTERLKALRLARDAAAAPAAGSAAAPGRTKRPAKGKKQPSGTLAEWLSDREKDGHG
jgi:hypothetical protein